MLRKRLKAFFGEHQLLYALYIVFRNRKDSRFLQNVLSKNQFRIYQLSGRLPHTDQQHTYYLVEYNWKTNGFFAIMRKVLVGCAIADMMGWIPYIRIKDSIFNVPNEFQGTWNMFEYYYQQPAGITQEELQRETAFLAETGHGSALYQQFGLIRPGVEYVDYMVNEELLEYMGGILRKYFILKPELEQELDREISSVVCGRKTLGVHYRGTDATLGHVKHPTHAGIQPYFERIDEALAQGFESVFLATDDAPALQQFIGRYGDRVHYFQDVMRGSTGYGVHFEQHERENDPYYLGREVLRDMLALSRCDGFIAGVSQVSIFARIQRYANGERFQYQQIIDHGLYKQDSKEAREYYQSLKRNARVH